MITRTFNAGWAKFWDASCFMFFIGLWQVAFQIRKILWQNPPIQLKEKQV